MENIINIEPGDFHKNWKEENLILPLVEKDDPILREEMPEFDFLKPVMHPFRLAHTLAQSCIAHKGIGLSAPQIGIRTRAFVLMGEQIICCINPRIIDESEKESYLEEGCLSIPGLVAKVKRPESIRVRYIEPNTNVVTKEFYGMSSRAFQHEMDHMNGILFTDRVTDYHLEQAKKRMKKK